MIHIKKLAFVLGISALFASSPYADGMIEDAKPKAKCAPKPKAVPQRHHHHHHHHPDLCSVNCCEIKVDQKEIDRSYCLQVSGKLPVETLSYERYRQEALEWAVEKREEAARLCKGCPEDAKALISCARYIERSWRHVDSVDFVPCDPCGEDQFLNPGHHHHHHKHHHYHCG